MKIHTIRIRNFRCFGSDEGKDNWGVVFRPHPGLNLLIGPNGSGKTSLVDALDIALNVEGHNNRSLISEYDFPNCNPTKEMVVEVTIFDLGEATSLFESDIQWIDPADGTPLEEKGIEPDDATHQRAVIIAFRAALDPQDGEIKWRWLLPKFPSTDMEESKALTRVQHESLGYFQIRPAVTAGSFSLGQYSTLGRHLRKLRYRLGKMPDVLRPTSSVPKCDIQNRTCDKCTERANCIPTADNDEALSDDRTIGDVLATLTSNAKAILGPHGWNEMSPSLGPRYGGLASSLSALTIGLRSSDPHTSGFIPFERLSTGEKYAFSFAVATAQLPGCRAPLIVAEEPETALYPSAVAKLIAGLQAHGAGDVPQVIMTTHAESVLRSFSLKQVFVLGPDRQPSNLGDSIESLWPSSHKQAIPYAMECLVMPGGPGALFSDKVLVVEGAGEAIVAGHLDHLAAQATAHNGGKVPSLASLGWSLLPAGGAGNIPDSVALLLKLGKAVAVVVDGDDAGREAASQTQSKVPTFVYTSIKEGAPALEDALLNGLAPKVQTDVLERFHSFPACKTCPRKQTKCWHNECSRKGGRPKHKVDLQEACLTEYRNTNTFPSAFSYVFSRLNSSAAGIAIQVPIDNGS